MLFGPKRRKKKTRKQDRKANRIITVENSSKVELQHWSQKLRINEITAETTKVLLMKNLPTLCNDSSLAVQFSISVSKKRAILVFTIKIIEMFELHASIRAEYHATIPLRFPVIIQGANV